MCTLAIYLCFVLLHSLDLFQSFDATTFLNIILGIALRYICTEFFSTSIDYFKVFSINYYILTSFVFLCDTGFVTELHFTKSYH